SRSACGGPVRSITVSAHRLVDVRAGAAEIAIGRPNDDVRFDVLDGRGAPCPIGIVGELYIAGGAVARGYAGDVDGAAFTDDPFVPGERMYRSGDLVRWLPDHTLAIAGRLDDETKIRGFRVHPLEVEHALLLVPDVR